MRDSLRRSLTLLTPLVLSCLTPLCSSDISRAACAESRLDELGLGTGVNLIGEYAARIDKPASTRAQTEQRALLIIPLSVNTEKLFGVKLGDLSLQGMVILEDPDLARGETLVDDAHAYSNLRAEDRAQLFEAFWERGWGAWITRLGKIDANTHFAVSENASYLINGAGGFSPTILGLPSYPDSAWSAQVGYQHARYEVLAGVFDGGSVTLTPTPTGARFGLSDPALDGEVFGAIQATLHLGERSVSSGERVAEASRGEVVTPAPDTSEESPQAPLHITLGAWTHRGALIPSVLDPGGEESPSEARSRPGSGVYLTGDLELARLKRGRALGLGWQAAASPTVWPLHLSVTLTLSEVWRPLWGAEEGGRVTLGASHLATQSGEPTYGLGDSSEQLIEYTIATPLSPYIAFSLSGVHLWGVAGERDAHLIVSRLTLGSL